MSSNNDQIVIPMLQRHTNGLPEMTSSDGETITQGAVLSFHNICYRVQGKCGFLLQRRTVEKEILSNINGIMKPGLNAIMGPSGAGKSSLLDILAARKDPCGLSGEVLINGVNQPASFRCDSGYVVRDDVVVHTLTVRENLQFAAALRLPTTMTNREKNERVNDIMEELDLDDVANCKVRPRELRKRTSIAVELITNPSILFLDEPTIDLNPSTANHVFLLLKRMSKCGRTIIFSIQQPRYSIFKLFDSLTLLASGKLIYHGPAQEALGYFESAGYSGELYQNPADFFLFIIHGNTPPAIINREEEKEAKDTEQLFQREKPVIEALAEFYANSSFYRGTKAELEHLSGGQNIRRLAFREIYVTSFFHQFAWIFWRSFKNLLGFPSVTGRQLFATVILTVGVGVTFFVLKNDCTEIQNRAWGLYVLTVFQCFSSVTAGEIFELEKKLFKHEYISGYYTVPSYFFGKLLSDLIPRRILPTCIFTFLLSLMLGLKLEEGAFYTMSIVLLVAYSTSSMALVLGAGEKVMDTKTFLVIIYISFMLVFLGMSLKFGTVKPWLSWLQYLSIPYYGYMALQHNEFLGRNFCPGLSTTESSGCASYVICTGEEFLTTQGIDLSPWGLWSNLLGLACMIIFFLTITYLKLKFLKKYS